MDPLVPQIARILEEAAAAPSGSVVGATRLTTLDGWDSMGVVFFVGEALVHWPGIRLSAAEVDLAITVDDLAVMVRKQLG
jgi:acyl carrier protein